MLRLTTFGLLVKILYIFFYPIRAKINTDRLFVSTLNTRASACLCVEKGMVYSLLTSPVICLAGKLTVADFFMKGQKRLILLPKIFNLN